MFILILIKLYWDQILLKICHQDIKNNYIQIQPRKLFLDATKLKKFWEFKTCYGFTFQSFTDKNTTSETK